MYPHEHLIVALVPVVAYVVLFERRLPTLPLLAIVFVGSQFPDLVDKPLAHQIVVLPSGRVFMHSLPTALPFLLLVCVYGWQTGRLRLSVAFVFAHLSHIFTDHYTALLGADPHLPPELLWPLVPITASPVTASWGGPGGIFVHIWTTFSISVLALSVAVLLHTEGDRIAAGRESVVRTTYRWYRSYRPSS